MHNKVQDILQCTENGILNTELDKEHVKRDTSIQNGTECTQIGKQYTKNGIQATVSKK